MSAWQPKSLQGGKMEWDAGRKVLRVRSEAQRVTLTR